MVNKNHMLSFTMNIIVRGLNIMSIYSISVKNDRLAPLYHKTLIQEIIFFVIRFSRVNPRTGCDIQLGVKKKFFVSTNIAKKIRYGRSA